MKKKTKSVENYQHSEYIGQESKTARNLLWQQIPRFAPKQHQIAKVKQNRIYPKKNNTQPRNMFASGEDGSMVLQEMKTKKKQLLVIKLLLVAGSSEKKTKK